MKKREEFFNKEIAGFKKKEQGLLKKLEKLDPPKPADEPMKSAKDVKKDIKSSPNVKKASARGTSKPKSKKEQEEEERKKKEA